MLGKLFELYQKVNCSTTTATGFCERAPPPRPKRPRRGAFETDSSIRLPPQEGGDFELILFESRRPGARAAVRIERALSGARDGDARLRSAIFGVQRRLARPLGRRRRQARRDRARRRGRRRLVMPADAEGGELFQQRPATRST